MNRRATLLLILLVLLVAPVTNAWCSTVCVAAAISSNCAHGLQPTDDLPMQKAAPVFAFTTALLAVPDTSTDRFVAPVRVSVSQRTPLRL